MCVRNNFCSVLTEFFRVNQVLEFINSMTHKTIILTFKKKIVGKSWNISLNFCTLSVGGCGGQPMLLLWILIDKTLKTQIFKPPECAATLFKVTKM